MSPALPRPLVLLVAAPLCVLALGGCAPTGTGSSPSPSSSSVGGDTVSPSPSEDATASPSTGDATPSDASGAPQGSDSPSPSSSPGDVGEPVGSRTLTRDGTRYTLRVYAPQRQSELVNLTVDLVVDEAQEDSPLAGDLLSDASSSASGAARLPNGFSLVDAQGRKQYLPATTGDSRTDAACTPRLPATATTGDELTFSCLFAGVPENLSTVTVHSDTFGNFANVTIR